MPTITTTVTSAAACGKVTTETTTEATPGSAAPPVKEEAHMEAIFKLWGEGTLTNPENLAKYYHPNVEVDYGAAFADKVQGTAVFGKHTGHSGFATWIGLLASEWNITWYSATHTKTPLSVITEFDWTATSKVGKEVKVSSIIKIGFTDGLVSKVSFYFDDDHKLVDAFVPV